MLSDKFNSITKLVSAAIILGGVSARIIEYDSLIADFSKYNKGSYQSVVAPNGKVYVTNSVGYPPIDESALVEVDPETMTVVKDITPKTANEKTGLYGVYGIDVDDKTGNIWVSNTRQSTVSYYTEDLTLGNQYSVGLVAGARDIYVDQKTDKVYVTSDKTDSIYIFSADHKNSSIGYLNLTDITGSPFNTVMSLVVDEESRTLFTTSMKDNKAAAVNLDDHSVKTFELGDNAESPSGVAFDANRKHLFIANQATNNTIVIDNSSGKNVKDITVGGGPLNAAYDPELDVVYVACRTGGKISVIDASDFSIITELDVKTPNQVRVGDSSEVFVTDKSTDMAFYKFIPKESGDSNTTTSSATPTGSSTPSIVAIAKGAKSKTASVFACALGVVAFLM